MPPAPPLAALLLLLALVLAPPRLSPPAAAASALPHNQPKPPADGDALVRHGLLVRFFSSDAFAALTAPLAFVGGVPGEEEVLPELLPLENSILEAAVQEEAAMDAGDDDPENKVARLNNFLELFECFCSAPITSSHFEITTCRHVFHPTCLALNRSGKCPVCNNATPHRGPDVVEEAVDRLEALLKTLEDEGLLSPEIPPDIAEDLGGRMKDRISEHLGLVSGIFAEVVGALRSCESKDVLGKMFERLSLGLAVPNAFCDLTLTDLRTLTSNYMADVHSQNEEMYSLLADYGGPVTALLSDEFGGVLVFGLPDAKVLTGASAPVSPHRPHLSWVSDTLPGLLELSGVPAAALWLDDHGTLFVGNVPVRSILTSWPATALARKLHSQLLVDMADFAEEVESFVEPGLIIPSIEDVPSTTLTLGLSNEHGVPARVADWLELVAGVVQESLSRKFEDTDPLSLFKEPAAWRSHLYQCRFMVDLLVDAVIKIYGNSMYEYPQNFESMLYVLGGDVLSQDDDPVSGWDRRDASSLGQPSEPRPMDVD